MHRMHNIDEQLVRLFTPLSEFAKEIELPYICDLSDESTIAKQTYPGIYRIDVLTEATLDLKTWVETFKTDWEHDDFKTRWVPNLKKKRIYSLT